jgi:protein SCO1/2
MKMTATAVTGNGDSIAKPVETKTSGSIKISVNPRNRDMSKHNHASTDTRPWINGQIATGHRFIPNVVVETTEGERKLFYDDLVKHRTVIIQFTSTSTHAGNPVTRNLKNVQRLLGKRCGRDVFLYTITADPIGDTRDVFAEFSKQFSPGSGWRFLTGEPNSIEAIKRVLFVQSGERSSEIETTGAAAHPEGQHRDCSMGLMRYGNDAAGLWGSVPTRLDPSLIVQRLEWVSPTSRRKKLTRKGPLANV